MSNGALYERVENVRKMHQGQIGGREVYYMKKIVKRLLNDDTPGPTGCRVLTEMNKRGINHKWRKSLKTFIIYA